jgi:4-alpha-glucanotransferase
VKRRFTLSKRRSGVLLHLTSLPSVHGIGDLGPEAFRFADFLSSSGQGWWQVLPIGPTGRGNSPYDSVAAFAGNPILISLEKLVSDGLLNLEDVASDKMFPGERVNYRLVQAFKEPRLRKAFRNFEKQQTSEDYSQFEKYCAANDLWLFDYAMFCALKETHPGVSWTRWSSDLRHRRASVLKRMREKLGGRIRYHQFLQYKFWTQWNALKKYCNELKIGLIGDIPFFVSHESVDVWAHQESFALDAHGAASAVAGVPPDYFSRTGQLWGYPLYRWDTMRSRGYEWWLQRIGVTFERFDTVRMDHFIGFQRCWRVDANARTAKRGRWVEGPGADFFKEVIRRQGPLELIAEDLGIVTRDVKALRERFGFPGTRVLQFAFGKDPEASSHLPHNYTRHCVVYTGTHDNDTTVGWFRDKGFGASTRSKRDIEEELRFALRYLRSDGHEVNWDMIHLALMSVADTAIIPVQDILGLGSEARMNRPGQPNGNWEWRLADKQLNRNIANRLRLLCETYARSV